MEEDRNAILQVSLQSYSVRQLRKYSQKSYIKIWETVKRCYGRGEKGTNMNLRFKGRSK